MAITFAYGAQSQYDKLIEDSDIIPDALYFVNDTQTIYRGLEVISRTALRFVSELPETLMKNVIYVVSTVDDTGKDVVELYMSNGISAVRINTSNTEVDINTIFEKLPKFTSSDAVEGMDSADDKKLITAGGVKQVVSWEGL